MLFSAMSRTIRPLTGASTPSITWTTAKPSSASSVAPMQISGGSSGLWMSKRSRKSPAR